MSVLAGRAVVVTGAGSGLGAAYALHAAECGAAVVVNDVDAAAADACVKRIGSLTDRVVADHHDVSHWAGAEALIDGCVTRFGAIYGLVSNAGIVTVCRPEEETEQNLRRVIEVNLLGVAFCGTHALRHMVARGQGSIVNVTSGAALGVPSLGAYAASKGGITALTYSWAASVAGTGVRVNAVSPNARTPLADALAAEFPEVPAGTDEPVTNAAAVGFLLSDLAADVNGQVFVTGGPTLRRQTRPRIVDVARIGDDETWTAESVAGALQRSRG
jgi:NAD(P)-dependent dehydrogenase (short-subunit alcohol dehydrogenase family)